MSIGILKRSLLVVGIGAAIVFVPWGVGEYINPLMSRLLGIDLTTGTVRWVDGFSLLGRQK